MAKSYLVTWEIELDADSPVEAAREALRVQRDRGSTATFFTVIDSETARETEVDLYAEGSV